MLLLEALDIEKSYGTRCLFKLKHLTIYDRDRIGIVGPNGAGKTTLVDILSGRLGPDAGEVKQHGAVTYVSQLGCPDEYGETNGKVRSVWEAPTDAAAYLSGGEETRLKLAQAFSDRQAKLIIADEPTSHLDLKGIELVEEKLKQFHGAVVIIAHDRSLLDALCNRIIEVKDGEINDYKGNYSEYLDAKELEKTQAAEAYSQYVKEKRRLEATVQERKERVDQMKKAPSRMGRSEASLHKGSTSGKKAKLAQTYKIIEKRLEQMEEVDRPKRDDAISFDMSYHEPMHGKTAVHLDGVSAAAGDRRLYKNLKLTVQPGETIVLVGPNGCGKSTLLQQIMNRSDQVKIGGSAKVGYFGQKMEQLKEKQSIIKNVMETSRYPETTVRSILARLLLKGEKVSQKVCDLSGGEKTKVAMARILLGNYNFLVLDEPTNYLDLPAKEELYQLLKHYPGTMLIATHDRYLMNDVADKTLIFHDEKVSVHLGRYADYLERQKQGATQNRDVDEQLKKVELAITTVLGQLSNPTITEAEKIALDQRFQALLKEKKALRG